MLPCISSLFTIILHYREEFVAKEGQKKYPFPQFTEGLSPPVGRACTDSLEEPIGAPHHCSYPWTLYIIINLLFMESHLLFTVLTNFLKKCLQPSRITFFRNTETFFYSSYNKKYQLERIR